MGPVPSHTRKQALPIHFVPWGSSGPRVLLLHSIGFDHRTWEGTVPFLQDGYRLVGLDLPGHGDSHKPGGIEYSLTYLADSVLRLMDEMGWEDAVLVGNSLGGGTSLAAALQAPDRVRGLALLNSVGYRSGLPLVGRLHALPLVPLLGAYAPALLVRLGLESVRGGWGSVSPERVQAAGRYLRDLEGRAAFFATLRLLYGPELDRMAQHYGEIRCPTLVLHGERDPLIWLPHAERLAREIPHAELVRVPRCGHFPHEEQPERVGRELRRFLDRITAGG